MTDPRPATPSRFGRRAATWAAGLALATLLACSPAEVAPEPEPEPTDPPVARDDAYRVPADASFDVEAPGLLANDDVEGGELDPFAGATDEGGTVAEGTSGAFTYEPAAAFVGEDAFAYTLSNDGGTSDPATVTFDVVAPWTERAPLPTASSRPLAVVVDGLLLVLGGEPATFTYSTTVHEYDPEADAWSDDRAPMPTGVSTSCAVVVDGQVYVMGGSVSGNVASDAVQRYDVAADSWTVLTEDPMPVGVRGHACAVLDDVVYAFGGSPAQSPLTILDAVWRFDPAAAAGARWSTEAEAMPEPIGYAAATVVDEAVYLAGDFYVDDTTDPDGARVYRYRPTDDGWVELPSLTTGRAGAGAWSSGPYLYVGGGGWGTYLTSVERYDTRLGDAGTWEAAPELAVGRRTFGYATDPDEGWFYAVGGWNGTGSDASERGLLRGIQLP